jgi:hypothetical protein
LFASACPFVSLRGGNYDHAFSRPGLHAGPGALHYGRPDLGRSLAPCLERTLRKERREYKDPKRKIQLLIDIEAKLLISKLHHGYKNIELYWIMFAYKR